jgi:hypothetical protein
MQTSSWRSALSDPLIPKRRYGGSGRMTFYHLMQLFVGTLVDELKNLNVLLYHNQNKMIKFCLKKKAELLWRWENPVQYWYVITVWGELQPLMEYMLRPLHSQRWTHVYKENEWFFIYAYVIILSEHCNMHICWFLIFFHNWEVSFNYHVQHAKRTTSFNFEKWRWFVWKGSGLVESSGSKQSLYLKCKISLYPYLRPYVCGSFWYCFCSYSKSFLWSFVIFIFM